MSIDQMDWDRRRRGCKGSNGQPAHAMIQTECRNIGCAVILDLQPAEVECDMQTDNQCHDRQENAPEKVAHGAVWLDSGFDVILVNVQDVIVVHRVL